MIGSKRGAEAAESVHLVGQIGRRAFSVRYKPYRKERCRGGEVLMLALVTIKQVRILFAENLRFPGEGKSAQG